MVEPGGPQQVPGRSRRRLDYTRDSKIAVMIRLLEKGETPEPRWGRRAVVAGIVIAVVAVALVFATRGFFGS